MQCCHRQLYLVFLLILALLPLVVVGDEAVIPHATGKHPRACRPEDARCIALQRDVCDPWNVSATDKCTFVQVDRFCKEDVTRINYLALFYCHNKVGMVFAMLAWMVLLFLVMTVTAEVFLCPAIEFLAAWLKLAPDIAGVTLFAFASGAPDLFTQVAALAAGDHVDIELAVSATFGGGLFIICVVLAAVILACPDGDLQVPDQLAFTRDALAYLVASLLMLGLLWLDVLTILDGLILLVGYFVYLGICMATRSSAGAAGSQRAGSTAQQYLAVPQQQPSQQQQYQQQMTDGELELVPFTLAIDDSGSPTGAADPATVVKSVRQAPPGTTPPLSPRLPPGAFEKRRVRSVAEGLGEEAFSHHYQQQQPPLDGLPKAASLPTHLPPAIGAPPGVSGWSGGGNRSLREAIKAYIRDLPAALEDCLHLHGKTGLRRWFGLATAPLVLFMHATMPAVGTGTYSMVYAGILAVSSPPFLLISTYCSPATLGTSAFLTIWFSSSLVLFTLIFASSPLPPPASNAQGQPQGNGLMSGVQSPTIGSPFAPTSPSMLPQRPRRTPLFALLAFVQSIVWLNSTADEVVALFEAVGRIWNIRRDVLGATVLAWGETVPDLVAVVSLAKAGQGTMAIAACFGGPVFNLLISMGGPIVYVTAKNGPVLYQMTSGVVLLVAATVGVLGSLVVVVPRRFGWRLPRTLGLALLGFYAFSQAAFLIAMGVEL